ncbi:MAG: WD40/YVTN/BNR-like repeat-containing protein [Planctomycetota bacterium]
MRRQRSIDAGATWLPVATPVPVAFGYESFASNGTDIIITSTIGTPAVSHDGGASWSVLSIPGFATARQVANEGDVFVAAGFVAGTNAFYEINVSGDGGQTWLPHPQPVASTTPFPAIYTPTIVDGTVFVDFAFVPNADILMSQDRGTSWQTVAGPAGWGFWVGSRRTMHLARDLMFPNPGGPASLWAYAGLGTTSLGGAAAGAGGIEPSLSLDGLPFQGSMPNLVVDDVVGGSLGVLAVSLAPPQPLPLGNALTIWPTVAPILCAYPTRGVAGRAGTGSFAMPLIVPVDPQLANTSLTTQAVVIDRAHPDGFVASEALEVWLR